jgi:hypothetical protein
MFLREKVHVASTTTAQSVLATEKFSEHRHDGHPPNHQFRRAAMRQSKAVSITEEGDDPGRHRLFSCAEVHFTGNEPAVPQILDRELVAASTRHLTVEACKFHDCDLKEDSTVDRIRNSEFGIPVHLIREVSDLLSASGRRVAPSPAGGS